MICKHFQESREAELDEVRNVVKQDKNQIEEKLIKEKQVGSKSTYFLVEIQQLCHSLLWYET